LSFNVQGQEFKDFDDRQSDEELIAAASNRSIEEVTAELAAKSRRGAVAVESA